MFTRSKISISLGVMLLILFGCTSAKTETEQAEIPNPAAVYCEQQGGRIELRTDETGGQSGVCVFDDGSECDEWAYYRGECQPGKSQNAPSQVSAPSYVNETYGFSFDPSTEWAIEDFGEYVPFTRPGYRFFVGYQWAEEDPKPFRTGMPAGDFVDGGTATLLGQDIPKHVLVFEGGRKVVDYGGRIRIGDLILVMYLDGVEVEPGSYQEIDISDDMMAEADSIIASFALTSGENPTIEMNP